MQKLLATKRAKRTYCRHHSTALTEPDFPSCRKNLLVEKFFFDLEMVTVLAVIVDRPVLHQIGNHLESKHLYRFITLMPRQAAKDCGEILLHDYMTLRIGGEDLEHAEAVQSHTPVVGQRG